MDVIRVLILLLVLGFCLYCLWRLVSKTGSPTWLSLLFLVPLVNVILLLVFVFSEWPVEQELARYRRLHGELGPEEKEDDMTRAAPCVECGEVIPPGSATCPTCGWSYSTEAGQGRPGRSGPTLPA